MSAHEPAPAAYERQLAASRDQFLAFVRRRIADEELAEDVLQDAYARALAGAPGLRDEERITAWFYRILRNAVIDAYRRRAVRDGRAVSIETHMIDLPDELNDDGESAFCRCLRPLLDELSPQYRELIERLELGNESPADVAVDLGITANNLKVRRHRARRALRRRLEETCRLCARHGCLDCTCEQTAAPEV